MTEEKKKKKKKIYGKVVVVQCGAIRIMGSYQDQLVEYNGHPEPPFVLYDVCIAIVQRGTIPGQLEGTVRQAKLINIVALDYATEALGSMTIRNADFIHDEDDIDKQGRSDMLEAYLNFLNREPSMVEHHRSGSEMP